jgi:23S rRNA pseudouridine1911/1915/1917 synthase
LEDEQPQKRRLDSLLAERFPETSRSTWQKLIKTGHVRVNGELKQSPKFEVNETDVIDAHSPATPDFSGQSLPILYQDDDVVVVNKPVGILTHAKGALHSEFSVADFFARYSTFHADTDRPGIVHRLDRDTSGVMIGARTPAAGEWLSKQFAQRKAKKTYIAVVAGRLKEPSARIELPIGRNPKTPSTFRVDPGGKSATTSYEVLAEDNGKTLVKLMPFTGRTHQLRVHMQYLAAPILGDRVYGTPADRLYLHAYQLEITLPSGETKAFTAPLPPEFHALFPEVKV